MKTDRESLKLIAAYLSGQMNGPEKSNFEHWIHASPENQRVFNEASKIWENSSAKVTTEKWDNDALWQELSQKIDQVEKRGTVIRFFDNYKTVFQIAASLLLLVSVIYFLPRKSRIVNDNVVAVVDDIMVEASDQVSVFYLPDSSKVWLNRKSRLTYPKAFGRKARRAKLEGEAYFEIRPDTSDIFTITTRKASIQVIGTSFNVKEEESDNSVTLTVMTGVVNFSDIDQRKSIRVEAGEKAMWSEKEGVRKAEKINNDLTAWRKSNNPVFEKEKLNPRSFVSTSYTWKKNKLSRSVINGTVKNNASLATYDNIVLKITYTKAKGTPVTIKEKIKGPLKPGESIKYEKRLRDLFIHTKGLTVEIESAEPTTIQ
jgi:transmembrane sensor